MWVIWPGTLVIMTSYLMAKKKEPVKVTVAGVDQNQPAHLLVSTFQGMYDRNKFRLNHYLYNAISLNINT